MSTKEYPLDHIQALHLLTAKEPAILTADSGAKVTRKGHCIIINSLCCSIEGFLRDYKHFLFRIYEPPAPEKLEPVELCSELFDIVDDFHAAPSFYRKIYGLLIAQAVREAVKIAREEREAEKKGEGK